MYDEAFNKTAAQQTADKLNKATEIEAWTVVLGYSDCVYAFRGRIAGLEPKLGGHINMSWKSGVVRSVIRALIKPGPVQLPFLDFLSVTI